MDNGALVTLNSMHLRGHSRWHRIRGTRGVMENGRSAVQQDMLRMAHEPWDLSPQRLYQPPCPLPPARLSAKRKVEDVRIWKSCGWVEPAGRPRPLATP